jgi:hypothetical protein
MARRIGRRHEMRFILDPLKFVHSINRLLWLGDKECLTTRGIEIRIFNIREVQGAYSSTVYQKSR